MENNILSDSDKQFLDKYKNISKEEDLINKWLMAMIRGEHTFLTPPDKDGKRWMAIKTTDIIAEFNKFKQSWESKDA